MKTFLYKSILLLIVITLSTNNLFASEGNGFENLMIESGKIYVVVGVLTIILCGIFFYLFRLEKKIKHLEKEIESK